MGFVNCFQNKKGETFNASDPRWVYPYSSLSLQMALCISSISWYIQIWNTSFQYGTQLKWTCAFRHFVLSCVISFHVWTRNICMLLPYIVIFLLLYVGFFIIYFQLLKQNLKINRQNNPISVSPNCLILRKIISFWYIFSSGLNEKLQNKIHYKIINRQNQRLL